MARRGTSFSLGVTWLVLSPIIFLAQEQHPSPKPNTLRIQVESAGEADTPARVELFRGIVSVEEVSCDPRGEHTFDNLEAGFYAVRVSLPGFADHYEELSLQEGAEKQLHVQLRPGGNGYRQFDSTTSSRLLGDSSESTREFTMAMRMREEGRIGTAIRYLRRAVELDPNFVLAYGELGLCHLWLKELEPAQVTLDEAIRLDSEPLAPYLNLAIVLSEQGKPAEAEDVLRRAIGIHPGRGEPHYLMAELRLEVGELDGAKQAALRAVALEHSQIPEVYLLLSNIYLRGSELRHAAQQLEKYIEKAPEGERVGAARASLSDIRTRLEIEAARPFEPYIGWVRLYRDGRFAEAARGLSEASTDFMQEASEYCFGAETDAQLQAAALLHTEAAVLLGTERTFHLRKGMEYLAHIEDESLRRDIQRRWLLAIGYFFQGKRRFLDAVPFFVDAAKLFPADLEIRFALGSAREAAGFARGFRYHLNIAEECYRGILEDDPESVEANLRLGHVLKLKREVKEAVGRLTWTLSHADRPEHKLVANLVLGDIYRELGDLDTAIEFHRAAVEVEPGCQAAVTALSHTLHRRGDFGDARYALTRFLEVQKADSDDTDGWWKYLLGRSQQYEPMMQQMREEVLR